MAASARHALRYGTLELVGSGVVVGNVVVVVVVVVVAFGLA